MNAPTLPAMCMIHHPADGHPVLIMNGKPGFFEVMHANVTVEGFNKALGVTPGQMHRMLAGSMFGWDCPACTMEKLPHPQGADNKATPTTIGNVTLLTSPTPPPGHRNQNN